MEYRLSVHSTFYVSTKIPGLPDSVEITSTDSHEKKKKQKSRFHTIRAVLCSYVPVYKSKPNIKRVLQQQTKLQWSNFPPVVPC